MTSLANDFRSWILSRAALLSHAVPGCTVESPDDERVLVGELALCLDRLTKTTS
jgi:hypothetical protein